jgi:formylglycine-generating enzyme required for sulfatase activity
MMVVSCAQYEPAEPKTKPEPSIPLASTRPTVVPPPVQNTSPPTQPVIVVTPTNEPPLAQLKAAHEAKLRELDAARTKAIAGTPGLYRLYLQNLEKQFVDKGDLQGVLAVQSESNRFAKTGTVSTNDLVAAPEAVQLAQKLFIGAPDTAERIWAKGRDDRNRNYLADLERLKVELTKRKRLTEAIEANAEIERVRPLVPPSPPPPPPTPLPPKPSPPVEPNTSRRASGPEPGMGWTNSYGMKFAPVPGVDVLFSIWETRVKDFRAFIEDRANNGGYDYQQGQLPLILKDGEWKQMGRPYGWRNPGFMQSDDHPVTCVNRADAQSFCAWLTQKERHAGLIGQTQEYRLPTDWEWSTAVGLNERKSGTPMEKDRKVVSSFPWGTDWPPHRGAGNHAGAEARDADWGDHKTIEGYRDSHPRTSPVACYKANAFNLFDLGGNVWEWSSDLYGNQIGQGLHRGGAWNTADSGILLSSDRGRDSLSLRAANGGFRVVVTISSK